MSVTTIFRSAAGAQAVHRRYRELLDRWPLPAERSTVSTSLGDTFVVASGSGDAAPVVLLHGSAATSAMWLGDVATLARGRRVYALDVPGEPGLSAPVRAALGSDAYAGWLNEVLDALRLPTAALVGVSLGGWLAADFATRHPSRVDRLVLVSPSGIGRQKLGVVLAAIPLTLAGRRGREMALRLVLGTTVAGPMREFVLLIHKHFRARHEPVPVFSDDVLARLTMPVLAVVGERDALLDSAGTVRRLAAVVPGSTVVTLPRVGHLLPSQAERIAAFL